MLCLLFAGQYGIPRPWYFPFQKSYWFEVVNKSVLEVDASGNEQRPGHTESRGSASGWVCEIKMVVTVCWGGGGGNKNVKVLGSI